MQDDTRAALDAETPVNPYSLLEAVNKSSSAAGTAWLIVLALMAYLAVTVAGVTHKDLLLDNDVTLPILQVKIGLTRFFLLAPIVLLLLHLGLLGRLALLSRKTLEFADALRMLETTDLRTHPLRLELDNFFLVQSIAGPERSRVVSAFLNSMSWLTLGILPLLLLLYMQVAFLPFHDATITWVQRLVVLADLVGLLLIGVFLVRSEASFFSAFWRIGMHNPGSLVFGVALLAATAFFSLVVATIPGGGREDRLALFSAADGALFGIFPLNLDVADADLVSDRDVAPGTASLSLRGRDLRFARLDRADLHQADMTGANLDGASLAGADLRYVRLQCDDMNELLLANNREAARCASARGANFARARLTEGRMAGADLRGARFEDARLEGAELAHALMAGANFARAQLQRADLSGGASLQGANFLLANLRGVDLAGAKLQMADLSGASMQGASLSLASLHGARLREADLEGASLQMAKLYGADMRGTKLQAADLAGAVVWRTPPPGGDSAMLADVANIVMTAPSADDMGLLKAAVTGLENGPLRVRLASLMEPLSDAGPNSAWLSSPDGQTWAGLLRTSEAAMAEGYRTRLTEHLTRLMCRPRFSDGAVAAGVVRRVLMQGFKGDVAAVYDRLRAADCPAFAAMPPSAMRDLATAAETARGQ